MRDVTLDAKWGVEVGGDLARTVWLRTRRDKRPKDLQCLNVAEPPGIREEKPVAETELRRGSQLGVTLNHDL